MTSQERSQLTQAIGSESLPLQRAGNLSTAEAAAQPGSSPPRLGALLLVLLVAVFALGDYALPFRDQGRHLWVDLWWTAAALLTGLRCFATARVLDHNNHAGKAWTMFGWGCMTWAAGMVAWDYRELIMKDITPFPALSDVGYLGFALLFAVGVLLYRPRAPSVPFALMEFSQLGIFIACIVAVHTVILYAPLTELEQPVVYLITALAYPVLYTALLIHSVVSLLLYVHDPVARRVFVYVLAGIALHALASSLYSYALLGRSYEVGSYVDVMWIAGFAMIYYAALLQRAAPARAAGPSDESGLPGYLRFGGLMPPVALLITLVVMVSFRGKLQPEMIDLLVPVAAALLIFIGLREWASGELEKRLNAEIRVSEEKLRQMARVAPVGIFRTDPAGNCIYVNNLCSEITGLSAEHCYAQGWMDALHPEDRTRVANEWLEAFSSGKPYRTEHRFLRADGLITWVLGYAVPERNKGGEIDGYVGSVIDITQRKEAEQALSESEERFRKVFASSPVMVWITRKRDDCFVDVNATFLQTTGWWREEVLGRTAGELGIWAQPEQQERMLQRLAARKEVRDADWRIRTRSGELRDILGCIEEVILGGEECLVTAAHDVTDRRRADAEMRKLSRALEQTADAVMITDRDGVIEYVNPAFEAISGYQSNEVRGRLPNLLNSHKQSEQFFRDMWENILTGKTYSDVFINRRKDGSYYYEEKTITPLKNGSGAITHFVSTGRDITQRMETQERLQFLAHHDVLTELPNRTLFLDRLKQSLAYARWHRRLVAVLFLDIDRFKNINDTLGHEAGDRLLQELSQRLRTCLRERDTVARFGGDEFVLLLDDIATSADVAMLAQKALDTLRPPFFVSDTGLHVTASIGISLFPDDGGESGKLLRNADTAMYRAKELGRNNYQFYSSDMSARVLERLTLENSLRRALEQDEFVLHYQPQIDSRSGALVGVEALLRWQHPELGLVPPLDFVPLLEETGLIIPVGDWVLRTACAQLARWQAQGWSGIRMAVNISGCQFERAGLAQTVAEALLSCGLEARHLELEITESVLMKPCAAQLDDLRQLGVRLSVDDFGTGYSSLGYLRRFPIDTLKIDRSFICDIPGDADDAAIARAIIVMGQSLRLELIAEGVETEAQRDFLQSCGCHLMQGYLFSRALPADDVRALLAQSGAPPVLRDDRLATECS